MSIATTGSARPVEFRGVGGLRLAGIVGVTTAIGWCSCCTAPGRPGTRGRGPVFTWRPRGFASLEEAADAIASGRPLVPTARFVELSGAGHAAAGDDNDAFTDAVVEFV